MHLIPQEINGGYLDIKAVTKLKEDLSFKENEIQKIDLGFNEKSNLKWDAKKATNLGEKEIFIPEFVLKEMEKVFENLDKNKRLHEQHISLYEKFIKPESKNNIIAAKFAKKGNNNGCNTHA
jgi:hypothetical protein